MIKEAMMKQAQKQLSSAAEKGFKLLNDNIKRVNDQNDMIIDTVNEMMRAQVALWNVLKLLHASDVAVFDKVEKDLNIKMEVE